MARIRTIKPEFWSSEQVIDCSPIARLLFIGLWNFADDKGRLSFSIRSIKAQIFPADDISSDDVRRMIDELLAAGLLMQYTAENKEYLQVTGWHHQKIDRPQSSKFPPPPLDASSNIRRSIDDGKEGKGSNPTQSNPTARERSTNEGKETELRSAIVRAFEAANSPNLPDTSRAGLWLSQGYDPSIVVAVVRDLIAKKPTISSLSYFDKPIREAHENRNKSRPSAPAVEPNREIWCSAAREYVESGYQCWSMVFGPMPGLGGCRCPREVLEEFGIDPMTGRPAAQSQQDGSAAA